MVVLEQLHTNDLSMNSGKKLREQLVENFTIIQKILNDYESNKAKDNDLNSIYDSFGK